jgi:nucleoid-associated protein EbfC
MTVFSRVKADLAAIMEDRNMARGFGGLPPNMKEMMKQAQKMKEDLEKAQEDAKQITEEGSAGGGMVTVRASGDNQIVMIKIEREVVDPNDVEMLQDLIMAATNEALKKAQGTVQQKISAITGGLNIPGI